MSGDFFEQLGIPEVDINLEVGSGTQAEQTAAIMVRYEKVLQEQKSDLCLVVGDVTSTMGVPCLTLRNNTERPETVAAGDRRSGPPEEVVGTNELIGTDPAKLGPALAHLMAGQWKKGAIPEMWDGKAAVRIVKELERLLAAGVL